MVVLRCKKVCGGGCSHGEGWRWGLKWKVWVVVEFNMQGVKV